MRKKRKKLSRKKSYKHVDVLFLTLLCIALLFCLILSVYIYRGNARATTYILITPTPQPGQNTLQMGQLEFITATPLPTATPRPTPTLTPKPPGGGGACGINASKRLVWLDSGARAEYNSNYEWLVWEWSSCSGDSMAMVFNAYGNHFNIGDVLEVELKLGVWNPSQGILGDFGFPATGNHYGFKTDISYSRSLSQIIAIANSGTPVIVGAPKHILVLTGGDSKYVYLADPSPHNYKRLTRNQFEFGGFDGFPSYWTRLSVLMTPKTCK